MYGGFVCAVYISDDVSVEIWSVFVHVTLEFSYRNFRMLASVTFIRFCFFLCLTFFCIGFLRNCTIGDLSLLTVFVRNERLFFLRGREIWRIYRSWKKMANDNYADESKFIIDSEKKCVIRLNLLSNEYILWTCSKLFWFFFAEYLLLRVLDCLIWIVL